jgi:predicted amidophosphoribosyltransferase
MELHDYLICSNCDAHCPKYDEVCSFCGFELPIFHEFTVRLKTPNRPYFINQHSIEWLDILQGLKHYSVPDEVLDTIGFFPEYTVITIRYLLKRNKLSKWRNASHYILNKLRLKNGLDMLDFTLSKDDYRTILDMAQKTSNIVILLN